jgi:peptidoglycan/LPS O-acetylase OafA/YrhL
MEAACARTVPQRGRVGAREKAALQSSCLAKHAYVSQAANVQDSQSLGERFPMIDVLRALAALLVASLHVRQLTWIGERGFWHVHPSLLSLDTLLACLTVPVMFGSIGVPIFFVISGYCIHRAHAAKLLSNPRYRVGSGRFWLRRFVRIYPVMLAAMLLTLACDWIGRYWVPNYYSTSNFSITSFTLNLFVLDRTGALDVVRRFP